MENNERAATPGGCAADRSLKAAVYQRISSGSLKVAMYLRISSEDAGIGHLAKTESDSIANQRSLLSAFISRTPELKCADILEFCDDGWSGKNFERPAVREMLEQARGGGIQCILVKDLSRFGRDYLEVGNYIFRIFPFLGIRFIAVNDNFDSSRGLAADSLETSFKTLFHDIYSRDISKKVKEAKRFRAERGEYINSLAPYGYVKDPQDKRRLVIDPEAAVTVRRIFQMAIEKKNTMEIARELNTGRVLTPMQYKKAAGCKRTWRCIRDDNFWTRETVKIILRDERYIGRNVFGKSVVDEIGKNHQVSVPRAEWVRVDGCHEGIVTEEEFAQAQENLREYKEFSKNGAGKGSRPLRKKVRCGVCGYTMHYYMSAKKPYYVCDTPRFIDAFCCPEERLEEQVLLDAVRDGLRTQALYAVDAARVWEEKHRRKQCDVQGMRAELSRLTENRTALDIHARELYEKFAFGELSKEEYLLEKRASVEKKGSILTRIEELEAELQNEGEGGKLENRFTDIFSRYTEVEELTDDIIEDVLHEIVVYPDHVLDIVWNYQDDLKKLVLDIGKDEQNVKGAD